MFNQLYKRFGKRGLDVTICVLGGLVLIPISIMLGLIIRLKLGQPVIFRQQRPGLNSKPFMLHKFRTMTDSCDANGNLLPDGERLTAFGRRLRAASLDELPTLLNVLRGDMSLVGPRPLLMSYLERYTPEQLHRHDVKPGVTGLAQVNGRNAIGWEEKFALDLYYVEHQSLWLDLKIIWQTFWTVSKQEGINQTGHATMEEYFGTNQGGLTQRS